MDISNGEDVQNNYLANAKKHRTPMIIYMMNGFQVKGKIIDFDRFAILVESDGKKKLLYKSAVSTIQPDDQGTDMRDRVNGYNAHGHR